MLEEYEKIKKTTAAQSTGESAMDENIREVQMEESLNQTMNMSNKKKRWIIIILVFAGLLLLGTAIIVPQIVKNKQQEELAEQEKTFHSNMEMMYTMISDSTEKIDDVGDTIYDYWYDAVYKKKHSSNIDTAILLALLEEEENINMVKRISEGMKQLYVEIKNDKTNTKFEEQYEIMKETYEKYQEYYEFVINVSGSFNTYSESKENLKKDMKRQLNKFSNTFDEVPDHPYLEFLPDDSAEKEKEKTNPSGPRI